MIRDSHPPDLNECRFDESDCAYNDDGTIELNDGLTDEQIQDAIFWHRFRDGQTASVMLVTGQGGSGKGILINMLGWKFKRYFPGCKAVLDYMPRRPFGFYHLFNQDFLVNQVDRMAQIANGECANPALFTEKLNNWMSSDGEVFFKNSIQLYDEYTRYHNKRRPHNPMGLALSDQYRIARHMNTLIIGATINENELDSKQCLPHVKYHVKMRKDDKNPMVFLANINWVRWSALEQRLVPYAKYTFPINGGKPRPELGIKTADIRRQTYDPKSEFFAWVDLFNSTNAIALNLPKSLRKEQ